MRRITNQLATDIVVEHHYLHRRAPCTWAFGLFENNSGRIVGVITYGTPSSCTLRTGICGPDEAFNVIELTRLWIEDTVPKNAASFFIGQTSSKVDKEIIVAYSEPERGHVGTVYQATNFIYTGLSAKRPMWTVEGLNIHDQTLSDRYGTAKELERRFGERFKRVPRPRKHRYVYFNAGRKRRKELLGKLRYPIEPYPKRGS